MSLAAYKKKRDFSSTPEPGGKEQPAAGRHLAFVVHRHLATRLHYDLRLELQGVLKSWAVPKGPSMNPADKRLAMMVEDHPFEYRLFKGRIPEGNYGAGLVEIWDQGNYLPLVRENTPASQEEFLRHLEKGSIKFLLNGKKLKGEFALARIRSSAGENAWLLIKHNDQYGVHEDYDSERLNPASSAITRELHKKKTTPEEKRSKKNEIRTIHTTDVGKNRRKAL
jgi:bifunctional non-homologous end joining protein LigD